MCKTTMANALTFFLLRNLQDQRGSPSPTKPRQNQSSFKSKFKAFFGGSKTDVTRKQQGPKQPKQGGHNRALSEFRPRSSSRPRDRHYSVDAGRQVVNKVRIVGHWYHPCHVLSSLLPSGICLRQLAGWRQIVYPQQPNLAQLWLRALLSTSDDTRSTQRLHV